MSSQPTPTQERRKTPRQRTLLAGTVRELNKMSTWSCTVRNICEGGARLEVANTSWLPNQFDLEIASRDMRQPVRVIWRDFNLLGVVFKPEDRRAGIRSKDQIIYLEAERERLRQRVTDLTS
jgi:hypothetical protein